jgi:uncharacterized protein (DUF58 family)
MLASCETRAMLTARGIWLLATTLALLGVSLWNNLAVLSLVCLTILLWFLGTWLLFAVCVQFLAGRLHVERQLSDERGPVQSLWSGQAYSTRVLLKSTGSLASPYLRVTDRVPYELWHLAGEPFTEGSVAAGQPLELSYQFSCLAPGTTRFEGVAVQAADPQGLFYQDLFIQNVQLFRVLPSLADARGHVPAVKRHNVIPLLGANRLWRPGSGSELLDLRDYLPGDPPRTIAWKVSARRDRLMTKEFESEVPIRCTLFVDCSASVRVGSPWENGLARLVEVSAAVAQAAAAARDLTGLCVFDEWQMTYVRPARGERHLIKLLGLLADAAGRPASAADVPVEAVLPLAYALAQETYPHLLRGSLNSFPAWLPWLSPQPGYALRRPRLHARSLMRRPAVWLRLLLRRLRLAWQQGWVARFSARRRLAYRWRKQMAALLSVRYDLGPGSLALLLEDDERCARQLQVFLAEHHVPYQLPLYDEQGRYRFAAPAKVGVLSRALLQAVAGGRDNELFVLLADLLEIGEHLGPLLRAVKVALARHHQVLVVCHWPAGAPLPEKSLSLQRSLPSAAQDSRPRLATVISQTFVNRLKTAHQRLRRTFGRLGVPVLCARQEDAVPLILDRLERLRAQRRGVR